MSKERIVCAAIHVMSVKEGYTGSRVVKGVDCRSIMEEGILREIAHPTHCNMFIHGFVTNENRFVSQEEALEISGLGNQLRFKDRKYLLPEDLY